MTLICANPPASPDEWERRGDASLADSQPADALKYFDLAAQSSTEPGRLAFKQATAYFHMGRYRDAERMYRCVLESESSPENRAAAHFNLGTTFLFASDGRDPARLADAIRSFQRCLQVKNDDERLRNDARHNLELAKLLWTRASGGTAPPPDPDPKGNDPSNGSKPPDKNGGTEPGTTPGGPGGKNGSRIGTIPGTAEPRPMGTNGSPTPGAGQQPVHIPESEQSQPLSPAEARELLRQASERIARERRALQKGAGTAGNGRGFPDW